MSVVGVADAAASLGVSDRRVRQMLADGVLHGERVGRVWVIDSRQLREAQHRRPAVGRPWSSSSAWSLLALADGKEPDVSPVERSRARKRLAEGLEAVSGRLRARSEVRRYYAHPGVLDRLADEPEVVRGGLSAAVDHGADIVSVSAFEGYIRARDLDALVARFALDDDADRPNVLLRVVDDAAWPFRSGQMVASRSVVAVDLLESDDPRVRRAGVEMAARA